MAVLCSFFALFLILCGILYASGNSIRPNIVFIIADDMGWDDVSFHGSNLVQTPNIDSLAMSGIAFDRYYSHCVCTPSRAALLTGKFSHTTGMQGYPLTNGEARGLPLHLKLLPEYLKELDYDTHLVGKWHVGHYRTEFLPTSRGFKSHFGFRGGYVSYYDYLNEEFWNVGTVAGMDLHDNLASAWNVTGYLTDVFTDQSKQIIESHNVKKPLFLMVAHSAPHGGNENALLEAPPEVVREMRYVELPERRIYTAMMKKLDDSVGDIVEALAKKKILDNTIIVFVADNGGMPKGLSVNYASNWPLRGSKFTAFEGGIRVGALLWTSALAQSQHNMWKGYMHVVDWLPTLLKGIGAEVPPNIDGKDLWNEIISNQPSKRNEIFEIYTFGNQSSSSIISGDYKLIVGNTTKSYTDHLGSGFRGVIGKEPCYNEAVENSKVYKVLKKMGKPIDVCNNSLRDDIRVNCNPSDTDAGSCVLSNGTAACLFNINEDPCETQNLYNTSPDIVSNLLARLEDEMKRTVNRPFPLCRDLRALPYLHNYTWATWADGLVLNATCVQ